MVAILRHYTPTHKSVNHMPKNIFIFTFIACIFLGFTVFSLCCTSSARLRNLNLKRISINWNTFEIPCLPHTTLVHANWFASRQALSDYVGLFKCSIKSVENYKTQTISHMVPLKQIEHLMPLQYMLIYVVFYLFSKVNNLRQTAGAVSNPWTLTLRKVHRLLSYCY